MLGPGGSIIIVLALMTALALLVIIAVGALPGAVRTVRRSFWCPFLDRNVTADFREQAWDGRRVEVDRCTAFSPATAIACEKLCLGLKKFPTTRRTTTAA